MKYQFLKNVPFFADLPEEDLLQLCEMVDEVHLHAGETLFSEGSPGDKAYVIKEGQIEILKKSGGGNVLLALRQVGEVIGEMSLLEEAPRFASVRARTDSTLLAISHAHLEHLLETSTSAARVMLLTVSSRLRSAEYVLRQSEKMAQLGTLTAGITHELNNPASAARRGAEQLREAIGTFQQVYRQLFELGLSGEQWKKISELEAQGKTRAAQPIDLDSLGRSDREEEIEDWLEDHGIDNPWDYAPMLVSLDYHPEQMNELQQSFPEAQFKVIVEWLCQIYTIHSLLEEIHQGTSQIGEIVKSLKSYVYLDQAPVQAVDVHEGLDNTLVMLRSKIKEGILLRRAYAENLPRIQAYASELNQVWTNLIDNAIDAMDGHGELTIRTRQVESWVVIEIEDNGPGIPQEIQERLFSPFFTTKPVGKGTGLGLNISYKIIQKHNGDIKVYSRSGKTRFIVRLPVNFEATDQATVPVAVKTESNDDKLRLILDSVKTIAVVGIKDQKNSPAYSVPAYLQEHGYRIFPVNPKYDRILGEKAYPDLLSLPDPVDMVLVFRRGEFASEIVNQAIQIGARVVWMQEGISSPTAATSAQFAGLDVVMNTCARKTHKRLMR